MEPAMKTTTKTQKVTLERPHTLLRARASCCYSAAAAVVVAAAVLLYAGVAWLS